MARGGQIQSSDESLSPELHTNNDVKRAIVVGGGPVGLAAALTLANEPHSYDVHIYESSEKDDYFNFDPAKAFLYLLSNKGQTFTEKYPSLQKKLQEQGVSSLENKFTKVPPEIETPIPEPKLLPITKTKSASYWIPRHEFTSILFETIEEHEKERQQANDSKKGKIECFFGKKFISLHPTKDNNSENGSLVMTAKDHATGAEVTDEAKLIVGSDGWKSQVRETLKSGGSNDDFVSVFDQFRAERFQVKKWSSPSTGLRLKALQLPAKFQIPNSDGTVFQTKGSNSYSITGKNSGPRNFLKLGCLPMMNDNVVRPGNCITRPDHEVWTLKSGEEIQAWFQKNYPRMPFQKESDGGIISDKEWERFAKAEGIAFPPCQYSPALQASSSKQDFGVVLVGDSGTSSFFFYA